MLNLLFFYEKRKKTSGNESNEQLHTFVLCYSCLNIGISYLLILNQN